MQKVNSRLKKLIREYSKKHSWRMGVSNYLIDVFYMENDQPKEDGYNPPFAEMTVDRRYLKATMKIYPICEKEWKERGDKFLEEVVAHELAHILTSHLYTLATCTYKDEGEMKDAWESLTESISRLSLEIK
jgi:hypothetical protein